MLSINEIKKSFFVSLWFMFLTFPVMVVKVNTIYKVIEWRWERMIWTGISIFVLSLLWRFLIARRESAKKPYEARQSERYSSLRDFIKIRKVYFSLLTAIGLFAASFPFIFSMYQTNIMITALIYVMLGLGLNIVVGLAGLLNLGYVAFFAIGAYSYALLNFHFGIGF